MSEKNDPTVTEEVEETLDRNGLEDGELDDEELENVSGGTGTAVSGAAARRRRLNATAASKGVQFKGSALMMEKANTEVEGPALQHDVGQSTKKHY